MNAELPQIPAWVEVDLDALAHNVQLVRSLLPNDLLLYGVVKANAYGCGAVAVSRVLVANGIQRLAVTHLREGKELRQAGINVPILVMGPENEYETAELVRFNLTPALSTAEAAERLNQAALEAGKVVPVHIKVETGLGRTGVMPEQTIELCSQIYQLPGLRMEGLFSHLATATTGQREFVKEQAKIFEQTVSQLKGEGIHFPQIHLANSAATLLYPEFRWNAVRLGTILYGQAPSGLPQDLADRLRGLKEVWSLKSRIVHLANLPAGHGVGYGRAYVASRPVRVAVVPLGYVDGVRLEPVTTPVGWLDLAKVLLKTLFAFLGWGRFAASGYIQGKRAAIIGKVAMQFTMLDVTQIPEAQVGEPVELPARRTVVSPLLPRAYKAGEEWRVEGDHVYKEGKYEPT